MSEPLFEPARRPCGLGRFIISQQAAPRSAAVRSGSPRLGVSLTGALSRAERASPPRCRRKKKTVHKAAGTDDKRLQSTLKRLGVNTIPGIEEVDIIQGDNVIHFVNPKGAWRRSGGAAPAAPRPGGSTRRRGAARACGVGALALTPPPSLPAVQASIAANTYVVSGPSQTKSVSGAGRVRQRQGAQELLLGLERVGARPVGSPRPGSHSRTRAVRPQK